MKQTLFRTLLTLAGSATTFVFAIFLLPSATCMATESDIAATSLEDWFSSAWPEDHAEATSEHSLFFSTALQPEAGEAQASEPSAGSGKSADEIAAALANPIASLISVPLQSNFDFGGGPNGDGFRATLNVQPVIPIDLNEDWNLITRVILPFVAQDSDFSAFSPDGEFGLGDTVASGFFSPKKPVAISDTANLTWGVGPALYLPTATDSALGADQFGFGPTAVALVVEGPLTYGGLINHIWAVGRTKDFDNFPVDRPDLNSTFIQPFVSYGLGEGWTANAAVEATYNWESDQWTVPLFVGASKVFTVNGQTMSLSAGPRFYLEGPDNAPDWGFRIALTFVFPR